MLHILILVPDVADDLLKQILHCDDAEKSAVFVGDDRDMQAVGAEIVEDIGELEVFVDEVGGGDQLAQINIAVDDLFQIVARMQNADDVVDIALIHGDARIALADDQIMDLVLVVLNIDRGDVNARRQYLLRGLFVKFQRRLHQLAFLFLEDTLLLDAFDDVFELVLCHGGGVLFDMPDLHHKAFDAREEEYQRG